MVTSPGSRPAALSQRQVDDFARGEPGEAAGLLRAARRGEPPSDGEAKASAPAALDPREVAEIAAKGAAPGAVSKRIAAEPRPREAPYEKSDGAAPSVKPPG